MQGHAAANLVPVVASNRVGTEQFVCKHAHDSHGYRVDVVQGDLPGCTIDTILWL